MTGKRPLRAWAYRGVVDTIRQGHPLTRALAIADSRTLVRALFLASAASTELLAYLREERTVPEIVQRTGSRRPDRLQAWLGVGADLGELRHRGDTYRVSGRRARALSSGDALLIAHYRSVLEYQVGPYAELDHLLHDGPGQGRDDLDRYADDIARVSAVAAPFVTAMIRDLVTELRPTRVLDVGCGTGIYTRAVLESGPTSVVDGVDLARGVIEAAREMLAGAGLGPRARLHTADIRDWLHRSEELFDLVLLLNNIYYFDRVHRTELYRQVGKALGDQGRLMVVSMTTPGSVAAAHLHFMLTCQEGNASLPSRDELVADLVASGFEVLEEQRLVPTEPLVGILARQRRRH
jgi:4-hydroxy-2,2'-bipyrrole-5-carbaldehyde O-methyltransferase